MRSFKQDPSLPELLSNMFQGVVSRPSSVQMEFTAVGNLRRSRRASKDLTRHSAPQTRMSGCSVHAPRLNHEAD